MGGRAQPEAWQRLAEAALRDLAGWTALRPPDNQALSCDLSRDEDSIMANVHDSCLREMQRQRCLRVLQLVCTRGTAGSMPSARTPRGQQGDVGARAHNGPLSRPAGARARAGAVGAGGGVQERRAVPQGRGGGHRGVRAQAPRRARRRGRPAPVPAVCRAVRPAHPAVPPQHKRAAGEDVRGLALPYPYPNNSLPCPLSP
jgi:hypothetical protein